MTKMFLQFHTLFVFFFVFLNQVHSKDEPLFVKNNEDICLEDVDPGPCQYYQVQWFWDQMAEECKEFHYGGCMGTKNRFSSKQQCVKQCKYKMFNPVAVPGIKCGCLSSMAFKNAHFYSIFPYVFIKLLT
ncbi:hypothetical protein L3Y34_008948 [Caenorhabditis briggsae]|uniref:BPTI/Kunitz inhibitor domain-containing protein n=2 Tax=Caenorhabditis briggsae TaxID=6238 RepID=A0AAE9A8X7_CAEBR|nr:hypothetical protein L3Y34_008948 [Caenorhabditis briggsae]